MAGWPIVAMALVAAAAGVAAQDGQLRAVRLNGELSVYAQSRGARVGGPGTLGDDPLDGPTVRNAPYSADAVTTVTQVLGDGTRIEQRVTAKFYRDSAGRVRREQTVIGLTAEPQTTITIDPDPEDSFAYALDPDGRSAWRVPRGLVVAYATALKGAGAEISVHTTGRVRLRASGADNLLVDDGKVLAVGDQVVSLAPAPVAGTRPIVESLGTKQIEGVKAIGTRSTTTIPMGQIGNDRPIEITDERWESPELKLLVLSRHHDPRTGDVLYQLMNIIRGEPTPDLFQVPAGYTILGAGEPGRGGRRGQAPR